MTHVPPRSLTQIDHALAQAEATIVEQQATIAALTTRLTALEAKVSTNAVRTNSHMRVLHEGAPIDRVQKCGPDLEE